MPEDGNRIRVLPLLKRGAGVFVALSAVLSAIAYPIVRSYEQNRFEIIKTREIGYLYTADQQIKRDFFEVVGDLGVASHLPSLRQYLDPERPESDGSLASILKEVSTQYGRYESVSVLDKAGRELIRVHRRGHQSVIASDEELEDRSTCACFREAVALGEDRIYVSRVILIPEADAADGSNDSNASIGVPGGRVRPIIHFSRAVADDDGQLKGVIVFNYDANEMLDELGRIAGEDSGQHVSMVINKEGVWLSDSRRPRASLGQGQDGDNAGNSFARQFAQEWATIRDTLRGELHTDKGLFLFSTVYPFAQNWYEDRNRSVLQRTLFSRELVEDYYAKIVLWIPESSLSASSFFGQPGGQSMIVFVYVLLAVLSGGFAYMHQRRHQEEAVRRRAEEMERQAYTDSLTAVWNRRYFSEVAERELIRSKRTYDPLVLLMLDIDYFKRVNDTYGHKAGDVVLQEFCRICLHTLREVDIFARLGGEEFVALLPNTTADRGESAANRLREAVAEAKVPLHSGQVISFTVSIGVSCLPVISSNLDEMLRDADHALYEAKRTGRNKVCMSASCVIQPERVPEGGS